MGWVDVNSGFIVLWRSREWVFLPSDLKEMYVPRPLVFLVDVAAEMPPLITAFQAAAPPLAGPYLHKDVSANRFNALKEKAKHSRKDTE